MYILDWSLKNEFIARSLKNEFISTPPKKASDEKAVGFFLSKQHVHHDDLTFIFGKIMFP